VDNTGVKSEKRGRGRERERGRGNWGERGELIDRIMKLT
jgi:hypothetical protein